MKWMYLQKDRRVPSDTIEQVVGYYRYMYLQRRYQSSEDFIEILPMIVKIDFNYTKNRMVFDKVV